MSPRLSRNRVITMEVAQRFAEELASKLGHSIHSAAYAVRVNPGTIASAIGRFERDECETEEDDAICEVLAAAKGRHILAMREAGESSAAEKNSAGVGWYKWRLETQAPKEHPRTKEQVEVTGPQGGPVVMAPMSMNEAMVELCQAIKSNPVVAAHVAAALREIDGG